jgi:uncharacterized protein
MKRITLWLVLTSMFLAVQAAWGADIPYLSGRVTDNAEILSVATIQALNEILKTHENHTGNQVVILTIVTLNGESIEDYAYRVFKGWKLGEKDKDNGVLIVIVPDDKRMRIEVGYGLEATLTDLMAGRIIHNIMTPKFRNGDYDGGILDGTHSVIDILEGGTLQEDSGVSEENGVSEKSELFNMEDSGLTIMERILIGAFIFGIIGLFTILGIFTPGFGWFLYIFLIPFWAMFPIVVLGTKGAFICFITYMIVFPSAKLYLSKTGWYKKAKTDLRTTGKASIGGFVFSSGGSGGSWSSGSSSSSGGGFSGGGGSSGGGGASGGW